EDLQDGQDGDAPRPATNEPPEILPRGRAEGAEAQGRQEDQDDRGGDEIGRPVEVVHLASEEIPHLVRAESEAAAEQDGGEAREVPRRVLDRDPRRGADESEAVEEVVNVVAADDQIPSDVRRSLRRGLRRSGEEDEGPGQG